MSPGMWNNGRFMGHLNLDVNDVGRDWCDGHYNGRIGERVNSVLESNEEHKTERYIIIRKLGLGNNSNAWLVRDMR